jgi:hypothetical protein
MDRKLSRDMPPFWRYTAIVPKKKERHIISRSRDFRTSSGILRRKPFIVDLSLFFKVNGIYSAPNLSGPETKP